MGHLYKLFFYNNVIHWKFLIYFPNKSGLVKTSKKMGSGFTIFFFWIMIFISSQNIIKRENNSSKKIEWDKTVLDISPRCLNLKFKKYLT